MLLITIVGLVAATAMSIGLVRLGGADIDRQRGQRAADQVALAAGRFVAERSASGVDVTIRPGPDDVRRVASAAASVEHATLRAIEVRNAEFRAAEVRAAEVRAAGAVRVTVTLTTSAASARGRFVRTTSAVLITIPATGPVDPSATTPRVGAARPVVRLVTP